MAIRIPWNKYEAAILLEGCIKVQQGLLSKREAVSLISQELRRRAVDAGITIDEIFRNENGIGMQFSIMDSLLKNKKSGLHEGSQLFKDTVALYESDPTAFNQLLQESRAAKNGEKNTAFSFSDWLKKRMTEQEIKTVVWYLSSIGSLYLKGKVISTPIMKLQQGEEIKSLIEVARKNKKVIIHSKRQLQGFITALEYYYGYLLDLEKNVSDIESTSQEKDNLISEHISDSMGKAEIISKKKMRDKVSVYVDPKLVTKIIYVADTQFVNGIRKNSDIEINQLRRKFSLIYNGEEIPADIDIELIVASFSIEYNGRYYVISKQAIENLRAIIFRQVSLGQQIFYYKEVYDRHTDFLSEIHIFVVDVLKLALEKACPEYIFYKQYFLVSSKVNIVDEILSCFENNICLTYEKIKCQMPYVTLDKIKHTLSVNNIFIWVRYGEYTIIDKAVLDEEEAILTKKFIENEIEQRGFSSLANKDIAVSLSMNPELSEFAIREVFYQKYMNDQYEKKGNIIYPNGKSFNVNEVLRAYCLEHDELTIDELNEYEVEVTGSQHQRALSVAYDIMIRVSKYLFVRTDMVEFDIERTDYALSLFADDKVIPLKAVTSFTSFPYVDGYDWNLYLLESFCRWYSRKYSYKCLFINTKGVGAIYPSSRAFQDYLDVMAEAVVAANVPLYAEDVGNFLSSSGYIARRTDAINGVILKAQAIINRGG